MSNGDSDLVSNLLHPSCQLKTTKLPRYSISTLGHTHKQTRTPNTQGTKIPGVEAKRERKRETHAHNRHLRENEREKEEESACCTRVSPQNLDPIDCPSKFNQISHASSLSAEVHHSHVGEEKEREGGGWWESVKELESKKENQQGREKESERQRERNRERPTSARRRGREKKRQRTGEKESERERGKSRSRARKKEHARKRKRE